MIDWLPQEIDRDQKQLDEISAIFKVVIFCSVFSDFYYLTYFVFFKVYILKAKKKEFEQALTDASKTTNGGSDPSDAINATTPLHRQIFNVYSNKKMISIDLIL